MVSGAYHESGLLSGVWQVIALRPTKLERVKFTLSVSKAFLRGGVVGLTPSLAAKHFLTGYAFH